MYWQALSSVCECVCVYVCMYVRETVKTFVDIFDYSRISRIFLNAILFSDRNVLIHSSMQI